MIEIDDEDQVDIYTFHGPSKLLNIKIIDLTIAYLKSLKVKGQEYIDLYNSKADLEFEKEMTEYKVTTPPKRSKRSKRSNRSGYIYFIKHGGYVKIRRTSRNLELRLAEMVSNHPNTCSTEILHIITSSDTPADEKKFHHIFVNKRRSGE